MAKEVPTTDTQNESQPAWKKWLLLLVVLLVGAAGGWLWRDHTAKQDAKKQADKLTSLDKSIVSLKKQLADAKKTTSSSDGKKTTAAGTGKPSAATIENVKASITSGNTAALEGYMAPTVRVIIAASEGVGDRTPAQAVSDVTSYLSGASDPWDFDLPAATLANWRAHFYKDYFPETAVVGRSSDGHVISFTFNDSGKISGVFMAANDGILTNS